MSKIKQAEQPEDKLRKKQKPGNIYDAFVKMIFGRIVIFVDFIVNYADPEFVNRVEIDKIFPLPTHNAGVKGDERIADLIFACPIKGGKGTQQAVIVFEHSGSSLRKLPIKLHAYASAIWMAELKSSAKVLSAIHFIVLRTGKKPCRHHYTMSDWLPKDENGKIIGVALDVDYEVIDLPAFDIDKLLGSPALRTTMGMLKKMTEGTELEFSDALQPLSEITDVEERMTWLKEMINFAAIVFKAHGLRMEKEAVQKAINPILEGKGDNMVMTIFEEKYYEGKAEGKAETLAEFKDVVVNVLQTRFHSVPKRIVTAIRKMTDTTAIQSLIVDAAVCQSIKEFEKTLQ